MHNRSRMTDGKHPRSTLRPTDTMIVTRVRAPSVQSARVTVMFADLRGYTGLAERLPPLRIVPLLDEFLRLLATATAAFGGEVFHVAGDGIMAGFGVRSSTSGGASDALAAGHAIIQGFQPIAERWRGELAVEAGIGIGLHLGEVAMGAIGPPRHRTTTLVGDTVNVAARLCSRARSGEVLFSCTVAEALGERPPNSGSMPYLQLPQLELRGRREPIDIWCVPALERMPI